MKLGIVLPRFCSGGDLIAIAQEAEGLGYESLWVTEHIAVPVEIRSRHPHGDGSPTFRHDTPFTEAMVALGFVAAITSSVRLGTAVIPLFSRDPLSLAKQAATLDALSAGRFELGVGAGWLAEEAAVLGHPSDHPMSRLDEAIDIVRKAWTTPVVIHSGRFYQFPPLGVYPHPPQGYELPIWVGGTSEAALRTAARRATGLILSRLEPEEVAAIGTRVRGLRANAQVAIIVSVGMERGEAIASVKAYRQAGASRLLLRDSYSDVRESIRALRWFAKEIQPVLEE